ncbi:MAG: DNRLRE domain-containing protein [Candidatus Omnitrophica bacterium]|nr:DNRLRE domain-containing protein [Candidatus Omnitrophota bacterium]
MKRLIFYGWFFVDIVLLTTVAQAQTSYTFYPEQDAWVNEANPTANYGNATYFTIRDRSGLAEAYLKFSDTDLNQLRSMQILSASLFLYQYQATYSPGDNLALHKVLSNWQEATISWQNRPVYEQTVQSYLNLSEGNQLWRRFDGLENCVSSWINGPNYGLVLENHLDQKKEEFFGRFYSSETSDALLRPYLTVTAVTPEPVSSTLFVLGAGLLVYWKRKNC